MKCVPLRCVSTGSLGARTPPQLLCRASITPPSSSHEDPQFSRRAFLRRSLHLSGILVATDMLKRKIALADGADIVKEAEEEVPELEEEITGLPEIEQKAVEEEVENIEEEISEVDKKLAKGEETEDEASKDASGIQAQIDAIKSILGF